MPILEIRERTALRRPILIAGFGGWGDAGSGATSAIAYLLEDVEPEPCAWLDPEACFDFTVQRPLTTRTPGGRWTLTYPRIQFYGVFRPNHERDLVLLTGPEPHFNWPTLTRAVAEYTRELGVEIAMTMGVFLGSVSHRTVSLVRRTLDPELDRRLGRVGAVDTGYQGPTGFVTALVHAWTEIGLPAASVWAAAPIYLRAVNPAVAAALLGAIEEVTEVRLDLGPLRDRAQAFIREVDAMLASNPELANQLRQMIDLGPETGGPESTASTDLPSGQSLVEELERFLRERRGNSESD
jgi:predicted ATP-grasp superfamily ATP-dependent carboligase